MNVFQQLSYFEQTEEDEVCVIVSEPPSLPDCRWDGDTDVGGSVRLSCSVTEGVPAPDIRWEKVNPEEISLPINMEGQCHLKSSGPQEVSDFIFQL